MAKFTWNDKQFAANIKLGSEVAMKTMCSHLVGDIRRDMKPGNHRLWPSKKGDGSMHWSSAPGNAPAPDTHALQDSISYATSGGDQSGVGTNAEVGNVGTPSAAPNEVVGVVGTQDIKGLWLEVLPEMGGGAAGMKPRPFVRTALPRNEELLLRLFENKMKRNK